MYEVEGNVRSSKVEETEDVHGMRLMSMGGLVSEQYYKNTILLVDGRWLRKGEQMRGYINSNILAKWPKNEFSF